MKDFDIFFYIFNKTRCLLTLKCRKRRLFNKFFRTNKPAFSLSIAVSFFIHSFWTDNDVTKNFPVHKPATGHLDPSEKRWCGLLLPVLPYPVLFIVVVLASSYEALQPLWYYGGFIYVMAYIWTFILYRCKNRGSRSGGRGTKYDCCIFFSDILEWFPVIMIKIKKTKVNFLLNFCSEVVYIGCFRIHSIFHSTGDKTNFINT